MSFLSRGDDQSVASGSTGANMHVSDTTESHMRRVSVFEMLELAKQPDPPGRFLLQEELARARPDKKVIAELLKHYPNRISTGNESKSLPIHVAASSIHSIETQILQTIINAHPDGLQVANDFGMLPIHKAAMAPIPRSSAPKIKHLNILCNGYPACLSQLNKELMTPLHSLISSQKEPLAEIVEYFLEKHPAAACSADIYGHLPLHKLCSKRPSEEIINCLSTLIDAHTAALLHVDKQGRTPLHWAVMARDKPNLEILAELLETAPEAVNVVDKDGFKPLDRLMIRGKGRCGASCSMLAQKEEEMYSARKTKEREVDRKTHAKHAILSLHNKKHFNVHESRSIVHDPFSQIRDPPP